MAGPVAALINFGGGSAPDAPSGSDLILYTKGDGILYTKDAQGTEIALTPGGGSAPKSIIKFSGGLAGDVGIVVAWMSDSLAQASGGASLLSPAILQYPMPAGSVGKLRVLPLFNTLTQDTVVEVMVNGASLGLFVTIPAGSTAYVEETATTTTWGNGDPLGLRLSTVGPDVGNLLLLCVTLELLPAPA